MTNTTISTKEKFIEFCCSNFNEINKYIDQKLNLNFVPVTNSVDIRESSNKIAPIDNNIYPAGFNNVCQLDLEAASEKFQSFISTKFPNTKRIIIYPESNTKNTFYLDHLAFLQKILLDSDYDVEFGTFDLNLFEDGANEVELISNSKFRLNIKKLNVTEGIISTDQGRADLVLLNNDQSSVIPVDWKTLNTPVIPSALMGWNTRSKGLHFVHYQEVVKDFCNKFSIEPELLAANFTSVDGVDFTAKEGFEKIAQAVDSLRSEINQKSKTIPSEDQESSRFFIKASQGTYGMGIMTAKDGDEVMSMNKKTRHKMNAGKNRLKFTSVIIQEGVKTVLQYEGKPAEISIYLIAGHSIGGFMRVNTEKDDLSNLNSKGMVFKKFCISDLKEDRDDQMKEAAYSVVARLSALAAAKETEETLLKK